MDFFETDATKSRIFYTCERPWINTFLEGKERENRRQKAGQQVT